MGCGGKAGVSNGSVEKSVECDAGVVMSWTARLPTTTSAVRPARCPADCPDTYTHRKFEMADWAAKGFLEICHVRS